MTPSTVLIAWTFAKRELRGGLHGFRIFLACLALGVAAIAAVGTVRASIQAGLATNGRAVYLPFCRSR
jgi:putative ABC transport system permease protein